MGGKTRGFYAAVFVSGSYVRVMIQTGAVNSGSSLNAYLELPHSELSKIEPSVSTRSKAPKPRRQCGRRRHSALITSSTTTSIHIRALTFNGRRGLYRVIVIVRQHFADNDRFIDLYFSLKSSSGQIASDNKTRNMRYRWGGRIQMSYKC